MSSFYSEAELAQLGLKSYGDTVLISKKASIYGSENIEIGDYVRIDDFCILSGKIKLGSYIHIAAYSALYGGHEGIELEDYANISSRCVIYALSDDFSGSAMTNPMIPSKYSNVMEKAVLLRKHVILGTGVTILPGVVIGKGSAVGSMSLVKETLDDWGIYAGIPCKKIGERKKKLLEKERDFVNEPK